MDWTHFRCSFWTWRFSPGGLLAFVSAKVCLLSGFLGCKGHDFKGTRWCKIVVKRSAMIYSEKGIILRSEFGNLSWDPGWLKANVHFSK